MTSFDIKPIARKIAGKQSKTLPIADTRSGVGAPERDISVKFIFNESIN